MVGRCLPVNKGSFRFYCIFLCNSFVLTCLRMAYVHVHWPHYHSESGLIMTGRNRNTDRSCFVHHKSKVDCSGNEPGFSRGYTQLEHWIQGWMNPTADLDIVVNKQIFPSARNQIVTFPSPSCFLYWLSSPVGTGLIKVEVIFIPTVSSVDKKFEVLSKSVKWFRKWNKLVQISPYYVLVQWFTKCAPRIPWDPRTVPRGSKDTFLWPYFEVYLFFNWRNNVLLKIIARLS